VRTAAVRDDVSLLLPLLADVTLSSRCMRFTHPRIRVQVENCLAEVIPSNFRNTLTSNAGVENEGVECFSWLGQGVKG